MYDNFYTVSPALVNFSPSYNNTVQCLASSALGEESFLQREQKDSCLLGRGPGDSMLLTFSIPSSRRWVTDFHPGWKAFVPQKVCCWKGAASATVGEASCAILLLNLQDGVTESWGGFHYCSWKDTTASSVNVLQCLAAEMQFCYQRLAQLCSHHQQQVSDACPGPVCTLAVCVHTHSRWSSSCGH